MTTGRDTKATLCPVLFAACTFGLMGCGESPPPSSDGVEGGLTPSVTIPATVTDTTFLSITDIVAGPQGGLAVADYIGGRVVLFDSVGGWVSSVGRLGEGPGEFGRISGLSRYRGGYLAFDTKNARFTMLSSDGVVEGTVSDPGVGSLREFTGLGSAGIGVFYNPPRGEPKLYWSHGLEQDGSFAWRSSAIADLLPGFDEAVPEVLALGGGMSGRLFVGRKTGAYRILALDSTGAVVQEFMRDVEPVPFTAEEVARLEGALRRDFGEQAAAEFLRTPFITHHPQVVRIREDPCARLWVLTGRGGEAEGVFDVFDPDGTWRVELVIPGRVSKFDVSATTLYAVVRNESSLREVHTYSLNEWRCSS